MFPFAGSAHSIKDLHSISYYAAIGNAQPPLRSASLSIGFTGRTRTAPSARSAASRCRSARRALLAQITRTKIRERPALSSIAPAGNYVDSPRVPSRHHLATASRRLRRWICNRKETHVFVGLRLRQSPEPRPQGRRSRRPSDTPCQLTYFAAASIILT